MALMTGLYPPTQGTVFIRGMDIRKNLDQIRQNVGICLQHNALYEGLSVEEHLRIFCCLKGLSGAILDAEVERMLKDTGLGEKRNAAVRALSGGMKRRLSVGIALCGGSRVVVLDEPTAGLPAVTQYSYIMRAVCLVATLVGCSLSIAAAPKRFLGRYRLGPSAALTQAVGGPLCS